jgi:hypothetical protein
MNDDTSNITVDNNSETKSREMTKKQTSQPSTPQQTVTYNEQQERAEAKMINIKSVSLIIYLQNMGDTQMACNPLNTWRIPITREQTENEDLSEKESIMSSTQYIEPVDNNFQKPKSPTKTQPDPARNSTSFPTKPPQGKRNVQIQRDALKEEIDKKSTFQRIHRKKDNLDQQNDIKSEVDFEQIQTQLEVVSLIIAIINQLQT